MGYTWDTVKTLPQDNPTRYPYHGINENIEKLNRIWKMQDIQGTLKSDIRQNRLAHSIKWIGAFAKMDRRIRQNGPAHA